MLAASSVSNAVLFAGGELAEHEGNTSKVDALFAAATFGDQTSSCVAYTQNQLLTLFFQADDTSRVDILDMTDFDWSQPTDKWHWKTASSYVLHTCVVI